MSKAKKTKQTKTISKPKPQKLSTDDRYRLYEESVQNPEGDIEFIINQFKKMYGVVPNTLREDFAGTAYMSCEWVKGHNDRRSYAIDLDPVPLEYGHRMHWSALSPEQRQRAQMIKGNVLEPRDFKTDVIVAFNFSYYIFKQRKQLISYFSSVLKGLNKKGVFFIDLFGGTEAFQVLEEQTRKKGFTYIWDCDEFNVINYHCRYYIHFKVGETKHERAFTYDWRMWTMPELRDMMLEAGFSDVKVFWEGDDGKGAGDGKFAVSQKAENCMSWIAYMAATP
jgi:hypothetical protein